MSENIDLTIIIVSYNTKNILINCIDSVLNSLSGIHFEIVIVDNNSTDGSKEYLRTLKNKNIFCYFMEKNVGFGSANNWGLRKSRGRYILFLNSDVIIKNDVIQLVVEWMDKNRNYGVASPNLYNKDGSVQGTGGFFPNLIRVFSWMTIQDIPYVDKLIKPFHPMKSHSPFKGDSFYKSEKDIDWVTGAFLMVRKEVVRDAGNFDEDFFMYMEEVEFCIRIKKKGWLIKYLPLNGVIHLGGGSGGKEYAIIKEFEGLKMLYKKHYPRWQYPILRLLIKIGCLWRIPLYGLIKGKEAAGIYAKAFVTV